MQPYFTNLTDFIMMGKHGVYVWSCWGIVLVVMLSFILYSRRQRKLLLNELLLRQARQNAN